MTLQAEQSTIHAIENWFASRGWSPFPFQRDAWRAYQQGQDGLIHVPTGAGKTYAAYMAALMDCVNHPADGLQLLYITPLRAMTRDIALALQAPVDDLKLSLRVESRTGDTSSSQRARQRKQLPHILITTPESLSLLLSQDAAPALFEHLRAVIVDEWHELLGSKRGTQIELALARIQGLRGETARSVRIWGMTATLSNVDEAAKVLVGPGRQPVLIQAAMSRPVAMETLVPEQIDAFPWAGHIGLTLLPQLIQRLPSDDGVTLVFTNTRFQAERWFQAIQDALPERAGKMAIHHGSLDREEREAVENGLKQGDLSLVVATSSLDLGVDFAPVDFVAQIGSPKGVARMLQRAGRSGHRPNATCHLMLVPTHALELLEFAALRLALDKARVEPRTPLNKPLDVLAQHVVTCALGGGFLPDELFAEVQNTVSYRSLTREEFDWVLATVRDGGKVLTQYPDYHRIGPDEDGVYRSLSKRMAQLHRMNIGTISSDASMVIRFMKGGVLGQVEESFLTRLQPGDRFIFAGRALELVQIRDMVAYVRLAAGSVNQTPRWTGGRLPFSPSLADAMRTLLAGADGSASPELPEIQALRPVFDAQKRLSVFPCRTELLVETCKTREGYHAFLYPFEGRLVHEGLAALLAWRLAQAESATFALSVNDYGIELVSGEPFPYEQLITPELFRTDNLIDDILNSMNLTELARRQFRDIARVAGLVFQHYPGTRKNTRQVQTSSGVLFDVFRKYDPENLFLHQAQREVLEQQFQHSRLFETLQRLQQSGIIIQPIRYPTPFAFPLIVERMSAKLSTETLLERIERLKKQWFRK